MKLTNERVIAKSLANDCQNRLHLLNLLPLDGDQTEEISMMFQEELNKLNANN